MSIFKRLAILLVIIFLPIAGYAYDSRICQQKNDGPNVCSQKEVGAFMQGITNACGNSGDCTLTDIMTVFVNIGNFVVGIVGGLVLLMYVIGGYCMLISGGRSEWVKKGKQYLTVSTIGLLIVMFSYLGIYALRGVLQYGSVALTDAKNEYIACSGPLTVGKPCDLNSTCLEDGVTCASRCRQDNPQTTKTTKGEFTIARFYDCVDRNAYPDSTEKGNPYYLENTCTPNLCPGGKSTQCCQLEKTYVE